MNKLFVLPKKRAVVSRRIKGDYSGSTDLLWCFALIIVVTVATLTTNDARLLVEPSKAITLAPWQQ